MLLGFSKNGRLEVTQFSVPATSETVSLIRRDALCNTTRLTAPGSINTCSMCEGQRWYDIIVVHRASKFRSGCERLRNLGLKAY